eukprot:GEMP01035674.1.p1 GENE.GEMP01035674.1~~GEMP01035674.1.p1  ORF type:complete len:216 (+),score=41.01 GEMP01035674.1:90-737(+)
MSSTVNISLEPEMVGASAEERPEKLVTINLNNTAEDGKQAAGANAASAGFAYMSHSAKSGVVELKSYVVENPDSLKTFGFLLGLCLAVFSMLGIINILNLVHPIEYIVCVFNLFFSGTIIIIEGRESWGWLGLRAKLFDNFKILSTPFGRAFFAFYIGVMVFGILPQSAFWSIIYIILGSGFLLNGLCQFAMAWRNKGQEKHVELHDNQDIIDNI